jgi:neutral ceramidase
MTPPRLWAGAGRALITPPVGFPMGGWSNALQDRSLGNDMDLTSTVLVVTDDSTTVALAELDLCLLTDAQAAEIRGAIADALDIPVPAVRVTATHNHSAPVTGELTGAGWMFEGLDAIDSYMTMVAEGLAGAAREAWARLEPVTVGHGTGTSPLAVNRRADMPGGGVRVAHNWDGPVDRSVRVARLDGDSGTPVATIIHYSAHPTILAGGNHYVTPDYPGPARRTVERSLGGYCLFLQGTPGDIGTVETFVDELEPYRRLGTMLGHDAAAVASRSTGRLHRQRLAREHDPSSWLARFEYEPQPPSDETLRFATRTVMMPVRDGLGDAVALRRDATARREDLRAAIERGATALEIRELRVQTKGLCMSAEQAEVLDGLETYPIEVHGVRIGRLGFIGIPMEPFIELGRAIADASPFEQTFVSGYTNGYRNYLPTVDQWPRGGYEVDIAAFQPEAATLFVEAGIGLLEELAGP